MFVIGPPLLMIREQHTVFWSEMRAAVVLWVIFFPPRKWSRSGGFERRGESAMAVGERIVSGDKTDGRGACPFEVAHTPGPLEEQ